MSGSHGTYPTAEECNALAMREAASLPADAPAEKRHRLVIIESPYAGDVGANVLYARMCMLDCLLRGEAPFASHLLYTQPGVLDDAVPDQRAAGIEAGLAWGRMADATVVYTDRGISTGMLAGIARAVAEGRSVEERRFGDVPLRGVTEAHLIAAAQKLIDAVSYDVNGIMGKGGNGGLTSADTVRAADALRLAISRYKGERLSA